MRQEHFLEGDATNHQIAIFDLNSFVQPSDTKKEVAASSADIAGVISGDVAQGSNFLTSSPGIERFHWVNVLAPVFFKKPGSLLVQTSVLMRSACEWPTSKWSTFLLAWMYDGMFGLYGC